MVPTEYRNPFPKLNRERRLLERRLEKQAKKDARNQGRHMTQARPATR
jgi:hypothetical protein